MNNRKYIQKIITLILFGSLVSTTFAVGLDARLLKNSIYPSSTVEITHLSTNDANPGDVVTIYGDGFDSSPGYIIVTGLKIQPRSWSDREIQFVVPIQAVSGFLYVRNTGNIKSNTVDITINHNLSEGQFEPFGFTHEETGMYGAAFLVETDGSYVYGITGFETLCTFKIHDDGPYELCSKIYLPQRVGDIKIHQDYLFCTGDHGLYIFDCHDLQQGNTIPVASLAGGSYMTLDVKEKTGIPIQGTLITLCEYLPASGTQILQIPLYTFENEELTPLGTFSRSVPSTERQHAITLDPLNPKVYISGYKTLLGADKYILEINISDPTSIFINHREETGELLAYDMESRNNVLWTGVVLTGTEFFRRYSLHSGEDHLILDQIIEGNYGIGRTTRIKIIDDDITIGSAWSGARPDIFLLDTIGSESIVLASDESLDWAFDLTGFSAQSNEYDGKIIVADEWGGFLTYEYHQKPSSIDHAQDYHWAPASAMTENLFLTDDRIYIANRGAGIWSAGRFDVTDESTWKHSSWNWNLENPQPHPISALCVRQNSEFGTLIAARGNNKAMAWGEINYGILYEETSEGIQQLAISSEIEPSGSVLSGSPGFSVIWPETDLVFMATGADGFRAFIVNPEKPSITIHNDCLTAGFGHTIFGTNISARDLHYYKNDNEQKIIVGSTLGLFVNEPSLTIFDVTYPSGIPNRNDPDRPIHITLENRLQCLNGKSIYYFDVSEQQMIAAATSHGLALFHISWISALNNLSDTEAWTRIKIPEDSFFPWWEDTYSSSVKDVCFGEDSRLYAVKNPQGKTPGGVWAFDVEIDWDLLTHNCTARGYYPGVQCGIDYTQLLQGWGNPDITTIHHPYSLIADGNTVYVTGWSGKIDRLTFSQHSNPPYQPTIRGPTNGNVGTTYSYTLSSIDPDEDEVSYYIDWGDGTTTNWDGSHASGQEITVDHTWSTSGSFTIKAKSKDSYGSISEWGYLEVMMPKKRTYNHPFSQYVTNILYRFFI